MGIRSRADSWPYMIKYSCCCDDDERILYCCCDDEKIRIVAQIMNYKEMI